MGKSKAERFGADFVIVQIPMPKELYVRLVLKKTTKKPWRKFLEEEILNLGK